MQWNTHTPSCWNQRQTRVWCDHTNESCHSGNHARHPFLFNQFPVFLCYKMTCIYLMHNLCIACQMQPFWWRRGRGRWHIGTCRSGRVTVFGGGSTMAKRARGIACVGERETERRSKHMRTERGWCTSKQGGGGQKRGREKREAQKTGESRTGSRCRILRQQHREGQGRWKMVSVRGELTVAYNLMFNILDSFSMGNSLAPVWA